MKRYKPSLTNKQKPRPNLYANILEASMVECEDGGYIKYLPLHEAAPKMYAMLEECLLEMASLIDEVNDQRCAHVNLSTLTQPDLCDGETMHRIQKLLAEARGEL